MLELAVGVLSVIVIILAALVLAILLSWRGERRWIEDKEKRKREEYDKYNLEYPADFIQSSSADQDQKDRFQGRHYK